MSVRVWIVVLCFAMLGSTKVRLTSADTRVGLDTVMNKLNYLQDKLEDIEQNVNRRQCNLQTMDHGGKDKLEEMEERILAKGDILQNKLEALDAKMVSMEANLFKILNGTASAILNIRSCHKEPTKQSGAYFMKLGPNKDPFEVYCEQSAFGGGWIVFQHRSDGKVNFYRNWADYREGFGNLNGEFWLGLEYVYQITSSRPYELMVEMRDYSGNYGNAMCFL
uniref:Fibrinogen C-terminal domain-containing protein n=1 Tax=Anopheles atroparvus TaxID=41427 RepID=A0A182IPY7_ANOAO